MSIVSTLKDLIVLRIAIPDSAGNVTAQVNHRTGVLETLKTLAGGNGEISVATDKEAILIHNGVANGAKVFYRQGAEAYKVQYTVPTATTLSATSTIFTPLAIDGSYDPYPLWVAGSPTEIANPLYGIADCEISLAGIFVFGASATGVSRKIRIEGYNAGWFSLGSAYNISPGSTALSVLGYADVSSTATSVYTKFRLAAATDDTVGVTCLVRGNLTLKIKRL